MREGGWGSEVVQRRVGGAVRWCKGGWVGQ